MIIGVPRERKSHEYRVAMTPAIAARLCHEGHEVRVERGCGEGAGFADADYRAVGVQVVDGLESVFEADLVVKVKEPHVDELPLLRRDQMVFAFLHLAVNPQVLDGLLKADAVGIAYDTVTGDRGSLPILRPMSQIAGRLASQAGIHYLERPDGARGILLGGIEGVPPARVVIIGGGTVGTNAAVLVEALGADLTLFDANPDWVETLQRRYGDRARCLESSAEAVAEAVAQADLVIGAALLPGARTPVMVSAQTVAGMTQGAVLVDVAIDQGGCFATSRPTTLDAPVFTESGVIHYCVANMPSAVARTSTQALCHVTAPYVRALANGGLSGALEACPGLWGGLSTLHGQVTHATVAEALDHQWVDPRPLVAKG